MEKSFESTGKSVIKLSDQIKAIFELCSEIFHACANERKKIRIRTNDQQSSFRAERYADLHRCAIGREMAT